MQGKCQLVANQRMQLARYYNALNVMQCKCKCRSKCITKYKHQQPKHSLSQSKNARQMQVKCLLAANPKMRRKPVAFHCKALKCTEWNTAQVRKNVPQWDKCTTNNHWKVLQYIECYALQMHCKCTAKELQRSCQQYACKELLSELTNVKTVLWFDCNK